MSGARLEVRHATDKCRIRADRRDVVRSGSASVLLLWRNGCSAEMSAKLCASSVAPNGVGRCGGALPRPAEWRYPAGKVHVVAHIWGLTVDDQDRAERAARRGWSRCGWDFVAIGRSADHMCPLDLLDGRSLAAESGCGWAYVVYPVGCVVSLAETYRELRDVLAPIGGPNPIGASDA